MVNLLHSKTCRPNPFSCWLQNKSWECHVWRVGLRSGLVQGCTALPSTEGILGLFMYQRQRHWRDVHTAYTYTHVYDASNPGVHPITVYHGMWWDSVACPTEWRVQFHTVVLGIWGKDMGHCGTSQVIPSHPMRLIGIAATVPGTFGIPNVPMDICGQCWICVEDRAHASGWLQDWPRLTVVEGPTARANDFAARYCHHRDSEAWWAQTWQAYKQIYRTWQSNAPHNNKIRLLQVILETVLLYGAKAWTRASGIERTVGGTYTQPLRYVLGIRWQDQQTSVQVYIETIGQSQRSFDLSG